MGRRSRDLAPSPRRRWRRWILLSGGTLLLAFFVAVTGVYLFSSVPEPLNVASVESARVVDHEGRFVSRIAAEADRVRIRFDQLPKPLVNAVVAVEDHRFWKHRGISPVAIARAALLTAIGRGRQGGSTITQQYVKNAYVGNERSIWRKIKEAVLAIKLERQRTKEEILTDYLNTIYFGRGLYGVQAAAKSYFGVKVDDLRIDQSALLAGIIRSPETYEPTREPELARDRRDTALNLMVDNGYLTREKAEKLKKRSLGVRPRRLGGIAPHLMDEVRREAESLIGANRLYGGSVEIQITLDRDAQFAALRAVDAVYDRVDDPEAALVAIDPDNGGIRAMVGARDYARRELNLARTNRQPGSTFKAAVLIEALSQGISADALYDAPARRVFDLESGPWPVTTYDGVGHGEVTLARATELSINTVFAQLILDLGPEAVARTAQDLGVPRHLDPFASLALGAVEVSAVELATMYATIADEGMWHEPFLIERITGENGDVLYRHEPTQRRVIDAEVARQAAWVLKGVIENGTGANAAIGREAAGKTGTTQNFRDAWFAGFTPDLATVVWNGYPGGQRVLRNVRGRDVTGGSFPADMWRLFMIDALASKRETSFAEPSFLPTATPTPSNSSEPSRSPTSGPSTLPSTSLLPTTEPSPSRTRPRPSSSSSASASGSGSVAA